MKLKNFSLEVGARIFRCFSEEPRVRILHLLYRKEKVCVSDLEFTLDYTQTKTSRHMTFLKNAGLVTSEKIDQWIFYSIKDELTDIIRQIMVFLEKDPRLQKDLKTYETLYSNRELSINKVETRKLNQYRAPEEPRHGF